MNTRNNVRHCAVLVGCLLATATAAAVDEKVFPGSVCQPATGPVAYFGDGSVGNLSTTDAVIVMCPVVRDDTTSTTNVISNSSVWVVNPGPTSTSLACLIQMDDFDTGSFAFISKTTVSIGSAPQEIAFPKLGIAGGAEWAVDVSCLLPPSLSPVGPSTVKNIRTTEP